MAGCELEKLPATTGQGRDRGSGRAPARAERRADGGARGLHVNPKLAEAARRAARALDEGGIDWGHAEALAFAWLLVEGIPVRLTGQDTERGTFSHRHLVLHDAENGQARAVRAWRRRPRRSRSTTRRSPSSRVGFEYGYSVAAPEALVLWEAQFGDFVNGAQIVIDQFIVSGLSKWGQTSRLTLLFPHGYEGNGPEHSRAKLERFLQLAAQENIRIANPTTAAQYFDLVRRQALDPSARPLVVMTPKGLLRLKRRPRRSPSWPRRVPAGARRPERDADEVRRLVLCSGKVYDDLAGHELASRRTGRRRRGSSNSIRSRSTPPASSSAPTPARGGRLGPGGAAEHGCVEGDPAPARGAAARRPGALRRPPMARQPSEGYPTAHLREQDRIVREALAL